MHIFTHTRINEKEVVNLRKHGKNCGGGVLPGMAWREETEGRKQCNSI